MVSTSPLWILLVLTEWLGERHFFFSFVLWNGEMNSFFPAAQEPLGFFLSPNLSTNWDNTNSPLPNSLSTQEGRRDLAAFSRRGDVLTVDNLATALWSPKMKGLQGSGQMYILNVVGSNTDSLLSGAFAAYLIGLHMCSPVCWVVMLGSYMQYPFVHSILWLGSSRNLHAGTYFHMCVRL